MPKARQLSVIAMACLAIVPRAVRAESRDFQSITPAAEERALSCLASAIAYEAGHEPLRGQQAVAEVILNRARNALFPKSVCGVVFEGSTRRTGCQFSFTCDGSLRHKMSDAVMLAATDVARSALEGQLIPQVAGATHYHADYVSPYWAPGFIRIAQIGRHIFYRMPGARDLGSFPGLPWGAVEPDIPSLRPIPGQGAKSLIAPGQGKISPPQPAPFAPWGLTIQSH